jgi:hypothetical protein
MIKENVQKILVELPDGVELVAAVSKGGKMNYITPAKMREIDSRTQEDFDIPVTILMENK